MIPEEIGKKVRSTLNFDKPFNKETQEIILDFIANSLMSAKRNLGSKSLVSIVSDNDGSPDIARYVYQKEQMAQEARKKGEFLKAINHTNAAINAITIDSATRRAQSSVDLYFALSDALSQAAGEAIRFEVYKNRKRWIETQSGAVGEDAPAGNHLNIIFFSFRDIKSFNLDGRGNVAVVLAVTNPQGDYSEIINGSNYSTCRDECSWFQPVSTSIPMTENEISDHYKQYYYEKPVEYDYLLRYDLAYAPYMYYIPLLDHAISQFIEQYSQ